MINNLTYFVGNLTMAVHHCHHHHPPPFCLFSGMEFAFVNANKLKIEVDKKQGKLSGRILSAFARPPFAAFSVLCCSEIISHWGYMGPAFVLLIRRHIHLWFPERPDNEWVYDPLISLMATILLLILLNSFLNYSFESIRTGFLSTLGHFLLIDLYPALSHYATYEPAWPR
jgi:CBS domain containing-hemolysin-like protein